VIIRNLVQEHEKTPYFPNQKNLKTVESNQPAFSADFSNSDDSFVIDNNEMYGKSHILVDDSMSMSYSISSEIRIDVDESMSTDFSISNEEPIGCPVTIDESMSVDFSNNPENQTANNIINIAEKDTAIRMIEDEKLHQNHKDHTGKEKLLFVDNLFDSNAKPSSRLFFEPKEYTLSEKIHIIIARYGPCSFGIIKDKLNSKDFGAEKINAIDLYKLLKSMNLESMKKRIRYYRSC
jgi:hypothetical protein